MHTEILFILDRSGSMAGLEKDTIGGFNSMLQKQKQVEGSVTVTTILFDNEIEYLHDRLQLADISPMTEQQYYVRGATALLDAIGKAIDKMTNVQKGKKSAHKENVIVIITTDGEENSSVLYSLPRIKKLISRQKELGWEFIFLGANIDAVQTAQSLGLSKEEAVDYLADSTGTKVSFSAISEAVHSVRTVGKKNSNWKAAVEEDFIQRS
jgi:uncharacterized protein YegL